MEPRPARTADRRFIPGLESLRGLAALFVCLFHTGRIKLDGTNIIPVHSWLNVFFNGHGAVVLFFVLSGFVLRLSLASQWRQPEPSVAAGYLVARFFRLFPVIVATVLLRAAVRWICDAKSISLVDLFRNATLLDISLNGVFWTLQVEVFGSLLVLAAFLMERRTNIRVVIVVTAALLPLSFLGHHWSLFLYLLYPFMFGYLLAAMPPVVARGGAYAGVLLLIALAGYYGAAAKGYIFWGWLLLLASVSATMIVGVLSTRRYSRALEWRPMRALGLLSYSFYALHTIGLQPTAFVARTLTARGTATWLIAIISFVLEVVITIVLAICMHVLVERPGNSIGHRLRNRLRRPKRVISRPSLLERKAAA